jgi:hypothetical protein
MPTSRALRLWLRLVLVCAALAAGSAPDPVRGGYAETASASAVTTVVAPSDPTQQAPHASRTATPRLHRAAATAATPTLAATASAVHPTQLYLRHLALLI